MPETGLGVFVAATSDVSAPQWQSFELRMRKRRAARLIVDAQTALARGSIAEAEAALEEARTLDSSAPDLAGLRAQAPAPSPAALPTSEPLAVTPPARLAPTPPERVAPTPPARLASTPPERVAAAPPARLAPTPSARQTPAPLAAPVVVTAAAPAVATAAAPAVVVTTAAPAVATAAAPARLDTNAAVAATGSATWELSYPELHLRALDTEPTVITVRPVTHRLRAAMAIAASILLVTAIAALWNRNATGIPAPSAAAPPVTQQPVAPPAAAGMTPPLVDAATAVVASPAPEPAALDVPVPAAIPPVTMPAIATPDADAAPAPRTPIEAVQTLHDEPISEPPARSGVDLALPIAAPAPAPPVVAAPEPTAPPLPTSKPAPDPAPQPVDELPAVRQVLSQYAEAYSSLNASAAKRVWPSLDLRSLARAFDGLQSQRVSLGDCAVSFENTGARAECRGSAEWTPKVGGGSHSQARHWSFDLQKSGGEWRIVNATAR